MKRKHLFLLAFSLLFVVFSCVKDNVVDIFRKLPQEPQPPATSGNTITMDSLRRLALNLPAIFSQQPQTRSTGKTIKEIVSLSSFFNQPATRTATVSGKNPVSDIYVVNYSGDAGFAIISADTRLVDVLAYSDEGNITDTLDNPGVKLFMHGVYDYADYMLNYLPEKGDSVAVHGQVRPAQAQMISARTFTPPDYDDGYYYYEEVTDEESGWIGYVKEPLVQVCWGQGKPFNLYADTCYAKHEPALAGCVATAMAQIIAYHGCPPIMLPYKGWDEMVKLKNFSYFYGKTEAIHCVATLFRKLGDLVGMKYDCNGGEADSQNADKAFNTLQLGYVSDGFVDYSPDQVRRDLRLNRPVYVRGKDAEQRWGHAWVVDGYKDQTYTTHRISRWYRYLGGDSPHELVATDTLETYVGTKDYVHCNWGWGKPDSNNGWFYDKIFTPNVDLIFRTDYPAEEEVKYYPDEGHFSYEIKMIKNLRKQ